LLVGYRFQSDDKRSTNAIVTFDDYRVFGGPLVATKATAPMGAQTQITRITLVSCAPLADATFEVPATVKALIK
jgi:hypothetical protein